MNKYVDFVTDKHLIDCISNLHNSYLNAKGGITKSTFYANKIDTIKLLFDSRFNNLPEEALVDVEILRQVDKSINNAIGTFHEEILGGISGYSKGNLSGYDIKSNQNDLFADIKNKHNTMNSSSAESLFQKLEKFANQYPKSRCFWVQILAKDTFFEKWSGVINGKYYDHERVFKISGDQFYYMLTGDKNAFYNLYKVLPVAISDYMKTKPSFVNDSNTVAEDLVFHSKKAGRSLLDQITFENFPYYLGFEQL